MSFEVKYSDLGGRIGKLQTLHGVLETPAFVPVIHPVKQLVEINFLKKLKFDAVITNAYIALKNFGDEARKRGIHKIINFDGIVMTDSGGYQVLEYGSVNVTPAEMAQFEIDIATDIAVPLDKPTGYGLEYKKAVQYVEETINNVEETRKIVAKEKINQIWAAPVQGAEHLDLVRYSAEKFDNMGFNFMALGSPVELMEAYEFYTLSQMISTLKQTVPSKPIHLFGAGHPLTIPLAIALGCDMFDSASYMLYAKDKRYMHSKGTTKLEDLTYLPCCCEICTSFTAKELQQTNYQDLIVLLGKHNLYVLQYEVQSVKQAIIEGRLWEHLMNKAHSHPKLMEVLKLFKNLEFIENGTALYKDKAIFFNEPIDQYRPEAKQFRKMVYRFKKLENKKNIILFPETKIHPFYTTKEYIKLRNKFPEAEICTYNPYLGIIPSEISDLFPAAQNLSFLDVNDNIKDYPTFLEAFNNFLINNKNNLNKIIIFANRFMQNFLDEYKKPSQLKDIEVEIIEFEIHTFLKNMNE